jgi:DHA2 family multidrug resistance protein
MNCDVGAGYRGRTDSWPTVGGWITENYSWRWVFYINLPIGIISLILISVFIYAPPYLKRGSMRVDGWGLGMLAIGMGSLQIMFDKGQEDDWFSSQFITMLAITAAVMLTAFVMHELRTPEPLVKFSLFRYKSFAIGIVIVTVLGFVLYGSLVFAAAVHAGSAGLERSHGRLLDQPARHRQPGQRPLRGQVCFD